MTTKEASCSCESSYQDKKYGKGRRIFNQCVKGWRCTVCGTIKTDSESKTKEVKPAKTKKKS